MKIILTALTVLAMVGCTPAPQCIKSHSEEKTGYHYGYGWVYSCSTTTYNKSSQTTCGYNYGYGYVFGSYTETVCDAYASPSTKEN